MDVLVHGGAGPTQDDMEREQSLLVDDATAADRTPATFEDRPDGVAHRHRMDRPAPRRRATRWTPTIARR